MNSFRINYDLNHYCLTGNKSTQGDLFYFNNARISMVRISEEKACFSPQFFVVFSCFFVQFVALAKAYSLQFLALELAGANCKCVWLLALALFYPYFISVFNFQSFIPIKFKISIPLILYKSIFDFLRVSTFTLSILP